LGWSAASRPLTRSGWRPSRLSPPGRGGVGAGRRRHRGPSPARTGARVASPRRGEGELGLVGGGIEPPRLLGLAPESPLPAGERGRRGWSAAASRPLTRSGWRPSRLSPRGRGGGGAGRRRHRGPSPARAGARVASPGGGEGGGGLSPVAAARSSARRRSALSGRSARPGLPDWRRGCRAGRWCRSRRSPPRGRRAYSRRSR